MSVNNNHTALRTTLRENTTDRAERPVAEAITANRMTSSVTSPPSSTNSGRGQSSLRLHQRRGHAGPGARQFAARARERAHQQPDDDAESESHAAERAQIPPRVADHSR